MSYTCLPSIHRATEYRHTTVTPYLVVTFRTYSGTLHISPRTWAVLAAGLFTFLPIYLKEEAVRRRGSGSLWNTYATDRKNLPPLQLPYRSLLWLLGVALADHWRCALLQQQ